MSSVTVGFVVAILAFASGNIGLTLQKALPEKYTVDHSSDTIKAVLALVTLLSALVLGLLIWTSYGVYNAQRAAVQTFAAHVLQLDIALADLGADAAPARAALKEEIVRTHDEFWGHTNVDFMARNYSASRANMQTRKHFLAEMHPANDAQRQALTHSAAGDDDNLADAADDVLPARQSGVVAASDHRDFMDLIAVLRIWPDVAHERDDRFDDRIRRRRGGERHLSDRRPERTLYRALPHFSRCARTGDRRFGAIGAHER